MTEGLKVVSERRFEVCAARTASPVERNSEQLTFPTSMVTDIFTVQNRPEVPLTDDVGSSSHVSTGNGHGNQVQALMSMEYNLNLSSVYYHLLTCANGIDECLASWA